MLNCSSHSWLKSGQSARQSKHVLLYECQQFAKGKLFGEVGDAEYLDKQEQWFGDLAFEREKGGRKGWEFCLDCYSAIGEGGVRKIENEKIRVLITLLHALTEVTHIYSSAFKHVVFRY